MVKNLSFEDALKELEEIVNSLEKGDISLEDAIKAYERGTQLKNDCEINDLFNKLYREFSPGPITFILKNTNRWLNAPYASR